jgi:hypothetical protein
MMPFYFFPLALLKLQDDLVSALKAVWSKIVRTAIREFKWRLNSESKD